MGNADTEDVYAPEPHPGYFPGEEESYPTPAWAKPNSNRRRNHYFVIAVILACVLGGVYIHRRATHHDTKAAKTCNSPDVSSAAPSVLPPDVQVGDCFGWEDKRSSWWNSSAHGSAQFPLNTDSMFFLSDGTAIEGRLSVFVDVSGKYRDGQVHAELYVESRYESIIDQTQVCHITKDGGGDGLAIMASFGHGWFDNTKIEVKVYIPVPASRELKIRHFETNLPYIRQVVYGYPPLTFGNFTMRGEGQDVDAARIVAETVDMRTSDALVGGLFETTGPISLITKNGMVSGVFNTSSSVTLVTSNAPINAHVYLSNDETTGRDAELMMQTANGDIEGIISLTSLSADGFGGSFDVSAVTSNAANNLIFHSISPRAKLDLIAHTTNRDVVVEMEPAFEGGFVLETTPVRDAKVVFPPYEEKDPEGRGRKRAAFMVGQLTNLTGRAWWDDNGKDLGRSSVEIKSTNAKVLLKL